MKDEEEEGTQIISRVSRTDESLEAQSE
jgi:hypothetical protein